MDVDKRITRKQYKLFGITIFETLERSEFNYSENVTPIVPIIELNLNDTNNRN